MAKPKIIREVIAFLLNSGWQPRKIRSLINTSNGNISTVRAQIGRQPFEAGRPIGPVDPSRTDTMVALRASGENLTMIGKRFGVSRQRVDALLKPKKHLARSRCHRAIYMGELKRPISCSECGVEKRIEAHHADYSEALSVKWLCAGCHGRQHRKKRSPAGKFFA